MTDRLAALLHKAFCVPIDEVPADWQPDEHGDHEPHRKFYEGRAARLAAAGVTVGIDPDRLARALVIYWGGRGNAQQWVAADDVAAGIARAYEEASDAMD